ncbi:MAG: hydrogenase maturation protease [Magnetospirillum sp.]|nr:hydrogenase maturation protease [Magnetospirillum sp.]
MSALVVGIGHPFRGDDAVGPQLADAVAALDLPGVTVLAHHGEGTDLMARWQGFDAVVVVDATCSGASPGSIRRWEVEAETLPAGLFPKSSHQFGLAEAVEMARLLGRLPPRLTVIGVEGGEFAAGAPLSPQVATALPQVVALVREAVGDSGVH